MSSLGFTTADIFNAANTYGIPGNLFAALINQESGYNPNAIGTSGEIGLTQLMPATAAELGVNPNIPQQNLLGGAKYLSQQYQTFGNWTQALEAYNAGAAAVKRGKVPASSVQYANAILRNAGVGSEQDKSLWQKYVDTESAVLNRLPFIPGGPFSMLGVGKILPDIIADPKGTPEKNSNSIIDFITSHIANWGTVILGAALIFAALVISNRTTVVKLAEAAAV